MSVLYNDLIAGKEKISIIGLGYVGMPIAFAFSKKINVIGFDVNEKKIDLYKSGIDPTNEVGNEALATCTIDFTTNEKRLQEAKFHIVAVPTPIKRDKTPDLDPIEKASCILGKNLSRGSIVVYESTVYPGVTEEVCIPILERESGLKCGVDFKVGYSPERINPGDKEHRLDNIIKIVSAIDNETLDIVSDIYKLVVDAGVYKAQSIKVAEAAKVIENSQRDINIAFMNELSIIFNKLNIDTKAVLEAAGTKWNFLNFNPGLVGGHCIGVDPYYLTYKAEQEGYPPQVILSGRKINDYMGKYIAETTVKLMIKDETHVKGAKVLIYGASFKENVPDFRNSKVIDIINELKEYEVDVFVMDPYVNSSEFKEEYGFEINNEITKVDAVIVAVSHNEFKKLGLTHFYSKLKEGKRVFIDIKGTFSRNDAERNGLIYWRL